MIFADSNILVYAVDRREPVKRPIAQRLLREPSASRTLVLSTQVLQEFYTTVLRKRMLTQQEAAAAVLDLSANEIVTITPELVLRAIDLHQQHSMHYWDAVIVLSAAQAGCSTVYSEDMQHGRTIAGVEIVNPFRREIHEPSTAYLQASTPEAVDEVLREAIAHRRLISFHYEGRPKEGEPHDYGLIGGERRLNFFQTRGRSRNGVEESGKWKTLDPAKMSQVRLLKASFPGTRAVARGAHKKWEEVIASVTLDATRKR
ncbi:PIN domain-containing protein [Ramlibacter humi]|uniref:PIN domain-containing protein n=1 Tax=Ramlibacter humi TaxID=2530451 RepID=UPI00142FF968|nr:PIN domain-containing protein [Ramlibacter humi]